MLMGCVTKRVFFVGKRSDFPSLPEGAALFLHAGRRFAFPSLPEGASLFRPTYFVLRRGVFLLGFVG